MMMITMMIMMRMMTDNQQERIIIFMMLRLQNTDFLLQRVVSPCSSLRCCLLLRVCDILTDSGEEIVDRLFLIGEVTAIQLGRSSYHSHRPDGPTHAVTSWDLQSMQNFLRRKVKVTCEDQISAPFHIHQKPHAAATDQSSCNQI